jgi:hypothetical protein
MRAFCCVLSCIAGLAAQTSVVFPTTHATIPNGSSYVGWVPFSNGISRVQLVYEDWDLAMPHNTPITRIGFRQDDIGGPAPQQLLQMEVRMGTTLASAATIGPDFDTNYVATPAVVYPAGIFTLPPIVQGAPGIVWVNLTTPYLYPGGNLLVEFRIFGNNNGNAPFNYLLDQATFVSPVTAGVQGCLHSGGQRPVLTSTPTAIGSTWVLTLTTAPANTPVALFVAPGQQMPAPYGLQILGLDPTCQGQLPLGFVSLSGVTDTGGYAAWYVPVPNDLQFNNAPMTSQVIAIDFFVQGSLVVSNADQIQFGVDPPSSLVYFQGSATTTSGSVYPYFNVVTLFN